MSKTWEQWGIETQRLNSLFRSVPRWRWLKRRRIMREFPEWWEWGLLQAALLESKEGEPREQDVEQALRVSPGGGEAIGRKSPGDSATAARSAAPRSATARVKQEDHIEVFGREIVVEADLELDEYGQFEVRLSVDGKPRFVAHFTDKRDRLPKKAKPASSTREMSPCGEEGQHERDTRRVVDV